MFPLSTKLLKNQPSTAYHYVWLLVTWNTFDSVKTLVVMQTLRQQGIYEVYIKELEDIHGKKTGITNFYKKEQGISR